MNWNPRSDGTSAVALKSEVAAPRSGRLGWWVRRKLVVPFLRRNRPPEYSARGVSVGLLIGMTPTLGIHLLLVLALWSVARKFFPARQFSLLVAIAWTCVMNPLTAAPLYYLFLVTGRLMLGGVQPTEGYGTLGEQFDAALSLGAGWLDRAWDLLGNGFSTYGFPMLVGCIPWAILVAYAGYRWSLWFVRARRRRRAQRTQTPVR